MVKASHGLYQILTTNRGPHNVSILHKSAVPLNILNKRSSPPDQLDYQPRLYDYIGGIIRAAGGISFGINGTEDHVHVLAKLRPDRALSDVLRDLKSNATGWMHDVFPRLSDFSWQRGYAAFTVSQSNLKQVQRYVAHQKEHHQKVSFRDEFILFLKANGIEYDERYI